MARLSFVVQYLIFCAEVEYADPHRPYRDSTLNGVDYTFKVPPRTEFPFEPDEFWLFARFYSTSDQIGDTRPLTVSCVWLDAPDGQEVEVWLRRLGPVAFRQPRAVIDRAWAFRNNGAENTFRFPGPGRYVFRLWHRTRDWPHKRVKAREFIQLEVHP